MAKAVFAGTFDPFTIGHLDIVNEASKMFEEVYIVIATNESKSGRNYDAEKMEIAIEDACAQAGLKNCYACILPSYMSVIEYAERAEAEFLIRGIRTANDYAYEEQMAVINKNLNPNIRTIFIHAHSEISSSLVRVCDKYGRFYKHLVPEAVRKIFRI